MKRILTILTCLSLMLIFTSNSYAMDSTLTASEIKFIDSCFDGSYLIFQGNDEITSQFIEKYGSLYNSKDYESLNQIVNSDGYSFIGKTSDEFNDVMPQEFSTWNSFTIRNNYKGQPNTVVYKAVVNSYNGTFLYHSHKPVQAVISYKGNIAKAGTKNSKVSIDRSSAKQSVTYTFGIYIKHTDGTYFDPSEKHILKVLCGVERQKQPSVKIVK